LSYALLAFDWGNGMYLSLMMVKFTVGDSSGYILRNSMSLGNIRFVEMGTKVWMARDTRLWDL
jgi:hypothetical protein